ncbi:MAG TPA: M28 family peptidase [Vicinamibacterales bacterium]|nr:M28 family peptidase [Vicinamibacterales bacterium]
MNCRRVAYVFVVAVALTAVPVFTVVAASPGAGLLRADDFREWLTYIASDELQGRATYSAGLGLAAAYIEDHLRQWGVTPAGDNGSYLQQVVVQGVKSTSRSSVTIQIGNETKTFRDTDGVSFPRFAGGSRSLTLDHVEFAGYGLDVPAIDHMDFRGKDVKGAAVVWLGQRGPRGFDGQAYSTLLAYRNRYITGGLLAAAIIGPERQPAPGRGATPPSPQRRGASRPVPDFTTTERLDLPRAPTVTASDAFYTFLFSRAPVHYDELKRRADVQDPLPTFTLSGVKLIFNVDVSYQVVRTQYTQNVVGIVQGSDAQLKASYVAFGAHYDHLGYSDAAPGANGVIPPPPNGRASANALPDDRIWNGADDDGSGTVALMGLSHAFAQGPRPKRSLLFVWHAGEEQGTYGSLYYADHPTVPLERIGAQLNIDMIGRNRDDSLAESNTVYLVGSDRISSELDQISRDADRALDRPMTLDYDMNDLSDPEQIYYRSDHYSYAAKGIPIIFFTTGLHADYHAASDDVSKILFDKLARITGLVYETGVRVANLDHAPARDFKGARSGRGIRQ